MRLRGLRSQRTNQANRAPLDKARTPARQNGESPWRRFSQQFYTWLRDETQPEDGEIDALTADEVAVYWEEQEKHEVG